MYGKRLFKQKVMYFKYAPPLTGLDTATGDRPKEPYRGAPREQCSVYYYWWAFLRENTGYMDCCANNGAGPFARLYADFGDVRDDDFFVWWRKTGRYLFCEKPGGGVRRLERDAMQWDDDTEIALVLPVTADFERVIEEVRAIYRKARVDYRKENAEAGANDSEFNTALYPVETKPVLKSLHQTLLVWNTVKEFGDKRKLTEIGEIAAKKFALLRGADPKTQSPIPRSSVHRYIQAAENIIRNVGEGKFPVFTDAETGHEVIPEPIFESHMDKVKRRLTENTRNKRDDD